MLPGKQRFFADVFLEKPGKRAERPRMGQVGRSFCPLYAVAGPRGSDQRKRVCHRHLDIMLVQHVRERDDRKPRPQEHLDDRLLAAYGQIARDIRDGFADKYRVRGKRRDGYLIVFNVLCRQVFEDLLSLRRIMKTFHDGILPSLFRPVGQEQIQF